MYQLQTISGRNVSIFDIFVSSLHTWEARDAAAFLWYRKNWVCVLRLNVRNCYRTAQYPWIFWVFLCSYKSRKLPRYMDSQLLRGTAIKYIIIIFIRYTLEFTSSTYLLSIGGVLSFVFIRVQVCLIEPCLWSSGRQSSPLSITRILNISNSALSQTKIHLRLRFTSRFLAPPITRTLSNCPWSFDFWRSTGWCWKISS